MTLEPYGLQAKGLSTALEPYEFGRAIYHLSKHRHFKGRDAAEQESDTRTDADNSEKKAANAREDLLVELKSSGKTLGEYLAARGPHDRRRGEHATREVVEREFNRLWESQARFHPEVLTGERRSAISATIFAQRPVFWRKSTLKRCRLLPDEPLAPKSSWISCQRRMLEQ